MFFNLCQHIIYDAEIKNICALLNIDSPVVVFRRAHEMKSRGEFYKNKKLVVIYVSKYSSQENNMHILAHELAHYWQLKNGKYDKRSLNEIESEARTIADRYLFRKLLIDKKT